MSDGQINLSLHTFESSELRSLIQEAVDFFDNTPTHPLPPVTRFEGVGVYTLHYDGGFSHYQEIRDMDQPIYVGKAVPDGWRTARVTTVLTAKLYARLREHTRSIEQTGNLQSTDFRCRFMLLLGEESNIIGAVEAELIRLYKPLWNTVVDGFGNHDPGSGRYNQAKSEWDILHPGRRWAERLTGQAPSLPSIINKLS